MFAKDFRERANLKMQGKGSQAALAYLIVNLCTGAVSVYTYDSVEPFHIFLNYFVMFFIGAPFIFGFYKYIREIGQGNSPTLNVIFEGFKSYVNAFILYFLICIYITLWAILFIIPGLIKAYSYSMAWYIMFDNPELTPDKAITESRLLMKGNKWRLFCLQFSYIGWILLSILTFGIYLFWLVPKMELAKYEFYQDLKGY